MNPCMGHSCDRCRLCRSGVCCLGRRRSREAELHAKVLVTAWGQDPLHDRRDGRADAPARQDDAVLTGSLPTAGASAIATREP
jgi:hypothetical protein